MAWNLNDIQTQISSETDGNATISSSSTDWANRLVPINRALFDWAETYDWRSLVKVHNGIISTSTGNASYSLPADFKKMEGFPKVSADTSDNNLVIVDPGRNYQFNDGDKYVNILGNDYSGKTMFIHAGTLASGTSVQFTYWAFPLSLSSVGQVTECPDPTYIVQKALYYIYKSREDGRFPEAKAEADRIMSRMIENENTLGFGYADRQVSSSTMSSFRIGRD